MTSDKGPVTGIVVQLASGLRVAAWTKTDGRGEYHLSGTAPGQYTLIIQKKANLPDVSAQTLTLEAGQRVVFDIHVPRGAVIAGRVVDRDKRPIKGALVRALVVRHDQSEAVHLSERGGDFTNDRGEFRIPYLAHGKYVLVATPRILSVETRATPLPNLKAATMRTTFYPSGNDFESAVVLDLNTNNQELTDLEIGVSFKPAACLAFTVGQGFSTEHISGSIEDRMLTNGPQLAIAPSLRPNKSYQVCGLAGGEYTVQVHSIGVQDRLLRITGAQAETVDLSKGSVDMGTVEPLGTGAVSGAIKLPNDTQNAEALSGITLVLDPLGLELPVTEAIRVQSDGSFSDSSIVSTEYRLGVTNLPGGYYVADASQKGRNVLIRGLFPGDGDVQITLANDGAALSGLVMTGEDKSVLDATVFLVPDDGRRPLHVQTDENGKYSFSSGVPPGSYRIAAQSSVPVARVPFSASLYEMDHFLPVRLRQPSNR